MSVTYDVLNVLMWAADGLTWLLSKIAGKTVDPMFGYVLLILIVMTITYILIKTFEQYFRYWLLMSWVFYLMTLVTYLRII